LKDSKIIDDYRIFKLNSLKKDSDVPTADVSFENIKEQ
jgi:hypothetical protein